MDGTGNPAQDVLSFDGHSLVAEDRDSDTDHHESIDQCSNTQSQQSASEAESFSDSNRALFTPSPSPQPLGTENTIMEQPVTSGIAQHNPSTITISDPANSTDDMHTTHGQYATSTATPFDDSDSQSVYLTEVIPNTPNNESSSQTGVDTSPGPLRKRQKITDVTAQAMDYTLQPSQNPDTQHSDLTQMVEQGMEHLLPSYPSQHTQSRTYTGTPHRTQSPKNTSPMQPGTFQENPRRPKPHTTPIRPTKTSTTNRTAPTTTTADPPCNREAQATGPESHNEGPSTLAMEFPNTLIFAEVKPTDPQSNNEDQTTRLGQPGESRQRPTEPIGTAALALPQTAPADPTQDVHQSYLGMQTGQTAGGTRKPRRPKKDAKKPDGEDYGDADVPQDGDPSKMRSNQGNNFQSISFVRKVQKYHP